jgi:TrmH family RNA methyltransferase
MGAIFRQRVEETDIAALRELGIPIYGAALSDKAVDVRALELAGKECAVAIGSEGRGLSREMLEVCDGEIIIPMAPDSESLNAAVAAAIVMWEMAR